MKKLALTLILAAALTGAFAQSGKKAAAAGPRIEFNVNEYDFGKIVEGDKKVSYDFVFTNTGDAPLVVTKAMVSCKCVEATHSRRPIGPGGQGLVSVTYNPKKQSGTVYKAIQVFTNTPEGMHIIVIKGQVVAK